MELKALEDNKTLHIKKGNMYKTSGVPDTGLVIVTNDIGDKVVMSKYASFETPEYAHRIKKEGL